MGGCVSTSKRGSAEYATTLQDLSSIPNRIFANGNVRTCCIFTQQGRKGINQDAMIVWEDFMVDDVTFCGIFDGHGPYGHLVARKVRDALPLKLISFLNRTKEFRSGAGFYEDKTNELWKEAFLKSYKAMDKELKSHPNFNSFCSGSTSVTIVKQGMNLLIGSIGDSRAILGSKDIDGCLMPIQLTVDLKPDLPREAERIKRCKGRVFSLQDEPEVARVWMPFDDAPGLAMARAFGDFCVKDYGVISEPEFKHRTLTERDQFLVLATDGIWDVFSNEEVVKIVSSAPSRSSAARVLVQSAAREWRLKYSTSKMDDCAVVCLFLDGKVDLESDYKAQGYFAETTEIVSGNEQHSECCFERSSTVRSSEESDSSCSLSATVTGNLEKPTDEDQDWSGLEGVTRVNSLIQLPRFSEERTSL